ncbi:hypothetical protein PG997_012319 [Apiospora hydei]|uniref:Uncharacterized protein n=1 Tax=Apiospora hydei TaxID=1337664 RepID=A0ABR1V3U2_9PEZI
MPDKLHALGLSPSNCVVDDGKEVAVDDGKDVVVDDGKEVVVDDGKEVVVDTARDASKPLVRRAASSSRLTRIGQIWRKGVAKAHGLSLLLEKCEDRFLVHPARRLGRAVRARLETAASSSSSSTASDTEECCM